MFWLGMLLGAFIGGALTLVMYACIIVGKESDKMLER